MFAVVKTGGKQYCVKPGDVFNVEKLDAEATTSLSLYDVLVASSDNGELVFGAPIIEGAAVTVEVLKHVRNKKIIVFKKIRRHNHRRKNGHRQWMTVLKVTDISLAKSK
jgi:large subunit ribosomal protein L21